MDINLPSRRRQDKKNKNRKYGRNGRTAKHFAGQYCSEKNCYKLGESRKYDKALGAYVPR